MARLPIVGVMGSGTVSGSPDARELGAWLAMQEVHLLTGGGQGVMADVSRAFYEVEGRRGLVLGIIPAGASATVPKKGYPNRWIEVPIYTHLALSGQQGLDPASRNHINALTSDVIVALEGDSGTLTEVQLALKYQRPIAAYIKEGSALPGLPSAVPRCRTLQEVQVFVTDALASRRRTA